MAKKKRSSLKTKLFIIAGVLAALQLGLFIYFTFIRVKPSTKETIAAAVNKTPGVAEDRKPILKLQLALAQYQSKNGGKLPTGLNQLVPTFIDSIPTGADGKQIKYTVEGKSYRLGDEETAKAINKLTGDPAVGGAVEVKITQESKDKLIASLDEASEAQRPIYDPTGKKDPFKPINLSPNEEKRRDLTPLENYALDRLSYAAFIKTEGDPKAILENSEGRGYTVTLGTKVGPNQGIITDIFPDRIVVVESITDLTGKTDTKTYEFVIGSKGSTKGQRRK